MIQVVVSWYLLRCVSLPSRDKDEDEGVPCESEFEKKVSDTRVRALKGRNLETAWDRRGELENCSEKNYISCHVRFCDSFSYAWLSYDFFENDEDPESSKYLQSLFTPHLVCIRIF